MQAITAGHAGPIVPVHTPPIRAEVEISDVIRMEANLLTVRSAIAIDKGIHTDGVAHAMNQDLEWISVLSGLRDKPKAFWRAYSDFLARRSLTG